MDAQRVTAWVLLAFALNASPALAQPASVVSNPPDDMVDASSVVSRLQVDLRYAGSHNFTGRPLPGYDARRCLLTRTAAQALAQVQQTLLPLGLGLKVYDCYRPQRAVEAFYAWSIKPDDVAMRAEFYPVLDKSVLFEQGYIGRRSGHTRGSTVDLTIVALGSTVPAYDPTLPLQSCTAPQSRRAPDNSLDFGTGYDCFSPLSHPDAVELPAPAKALRLLLRTLMIDAGFAPLSTEWWHFSLRAEPYPETYFDFPLSAGASSGLV